MKAVAVTAAVAVATFGGVTAAHAAPGDDANATGTFLGGSILDLIDLDDVVDLEGASATNDGVPNETVTDFNTLDLTALGLVNVTSPTGVQIPLNLADLGVLGQYASADPDASSFGASGAVGSDGVVGVGPVPGEPPGPLTLNLANAVGSLTGSVGAGLVNEIGNLNLSVGAVTASAGLEGATGVTRDYTIADADLTFTSPTVAGLANAVNSAVVPLQNTVNGLQAVLFGALNGVLGVLDVLGVIESSLTVGTVNLAGAISPLLTGEITSPDHPGVSINLGSGLVEVDLAEIIDLNDLPPNTEILSGATLDLVSESVVGLVEDLVQDVVERLTTTINSITVVGSVSIPPVVVGPIVVTPRIPLVNINTTVGTLLGPNPTQGIEVLGGAVNLLPVGTIVGALTTPLRALVDSIPGALSGVLTPVNNLLAPALDAVLPAVASLRANNQSDAGGVYSETGLILTVLPLLGINAVTIELANATVGPNAVDANTDVGITAPTANQVFYVPDPDGVRDVTVTGVGQPGASVAVVVDGVTQNVPVTGAGANGTWTATFTGLDPGPYTATATQDVDGTTATVAFSIAAAPDIAIVDPTDGEEFSVAGPDDVYDVPVSGTGFAGSAVDVEVEVDGTTVTESTTVAPGGAWNVQFDDLPVGDYTALATQAYDGSEAEVDFAVVEAEDVVIDTPADGAEIVVDGPADLADVPVGGTGAPNATVSVTIGATTLTDVVDGVTGRWDVTFSGLAVDDDPYVATATQDVDDSVDTVEFTVVAAQDVDITAPTPNQVILVPNVGGTADVVVSGTGQTGESVTVSIPGRDPVAPATVTNGTWSVTFPAVPIGGPYTATAVQSDGSQDTVNFSVAATADVTITDPTPNEVFPVAGPTSTTSVSVTGTGQEGATIAVTVGTTTQNAVVTGGVWTTTFTNLPVGTYTAEAEQALDGSSAEVTFVVEAATDVEIVEPASGSTILLDPPATNTDVTVAGTGYSGATVTVTIPGQLPLSDLVEGGAWSVDFSALGVGTYTATAVQDLDGSTDTSTFTVRVTDGVVITSPQEGARLLVAEPGDERDVVVSGEGEAGLDVDVTLPGYGTESTTVSPLGLWTVTFTGVGEDDYTATAVQEGGATDSVDFSVAAAEDIVIDTPAPDQVFPVPSPTSTEDVLVSGTAEAYEPIEVTVDGDVIPLIVAPDGTWSLTAEDLPVGEYTAEAELLFNGSTDEVDFVVEAIADVDILLPEGGEEYVVDGPTGTASVTVSGTGYTGQTVTVTLPDVGSLPSPVVGGTWSVTFPTVPIGEYTATASQSGDLSTDSVDFTVREAAGVVIDEPEGGDVIVVPDLDDDTTITVSGTGEPEREITVTIPGLDPVTTEVDENGDWELDVPEVPVGEHVITATQEGGSSTSVTVSVEAADDVEITEPADGSTIPAPGDTIDVPVSGIGQPGAIITIVLDDGEEGEQTETATVTGDGTWSETFDDVAVGEHTVTATQDVDGSTSTSAFEIEAITDVEITAPDDDEVFQVDAPTDTTPVTVEGTGYDGQTVSVDIPNVGTLTSPVTGGEWSVTFPAVPVGEHTATATQTGDGSTAEVTFTVDERDDVTITTPGDGDTVLIPGDEGPVEVCGTGEPGAEIVVTVGDLPPVTTEADAEDGTWCVSVDDVPAGEHEVTAEQEEDGSSTTITIDVVPAGDVSITTPTDGEQIPATDPDATTDVEVTGTGGPGLVIEVSLDGDEPVEVEVDENGEWTVTFDDVPVGDHEVEAYQPFDDTTDTVEFSIFDAVAPVEITSPADGTQLTVPDDGDTLALVLSGIGEPEAEIEVAVPGITGTQTATVTDEGEWTVTFENVGVGSYTATATQDVDETSDSVTVAIVVAPIDTSKARADVTQQRIVRAPNATQTVVVSGFQPGETVSGTVRSTPFELVPTIADAAGNARITFAVSDNIELGAHRVDVRGSITGELPAERENTAFTVVAPAGLLPGTGYDGNGALLLGGLGLSLLIAGAAIWTLRRRRTVE